MQDSPESKDHFTLSARNKKTETNTACSKDQKVILMSQAQSKFEVGAKAGRIGCIFIFWSAECAQHFLITPNAVAGSFPPAHHEA